MDKTIEEIFTETRVELDKVLKQLDVVRARRDVSTQHIGRELSLSYTGLQLSRMWMGECSFILTGKYPYTGTNEASTPSEIQKAVDTAIVDNEELKKYEKDNYIECIGRLRTYIDSLHDTLQQQVAITESYKRLGLAWSNTFTNIREGRMWLGVAMGKIRDNNVK